MILLQRITISILLMMLPAYSSGQYIVIDEGNVSINSGVLSLNETNIIQNGELTTHTGTRIYITGAENSGLFGINPFSIHSLAINSNCILENELSIIDSIIFISGVLDIGNNSIDLHGILFGENENARIFSTGNGEISAKTNLSANQSSTPGNLGLQITVNNSFPLFEVTRGHLPVENMTTSIHRYYSIPEITDEYLVTFSFLNNETGIDKGTAFCLWGEYSGTWEQIQSSSSHDSETKISAKLSKPYNKLTVFQYEENDIIISKGFSPNGDGINDFFTITGIDEYPYNKLIIFNQWGEIVYEASPYTNDWNGESEHRLASQKNKKLFDGTYFYIFYKENGNKNSVKTGALEIKSSLN